MKEQVQLLQSHFEGDIDCLELYAQLPIFRISLNNGDGIVNFHDILNSVKSLKPEQRCLISSIISICKLILVIQRQQQLQRERCLWLATF